MHLSVCHRSVLEVNRQIPLVKIVRSSSLATSPSADRLWLSSGIVGLDSMYAEPFEEAEEGLMDHAVKE